MKKAAWSALVAVGVIGAMQACGGDPATSIFAPGGDDAGGEWSSSSSSSGSFSELPDSGEVPDAPPPVEVDCDASPGACAPPGVCGDGEPGLGEACDDGNTLDGDGCSSSCQVEGPYWACAFGIACVDVRDCSLLDDGGVDAGDAGCVAPPKAPVCGDGAIDPGELCDDANVTGGDGCSADCKAVEANWVCPDPGKKCVSTMVCGDGKITGTEQCDDKNATPGDGCSATCQIEPGWACLIPGIACVAAACGDGLLAGDEECDDGNVKNDDGCSSSCRLQSVTEEIPPTTGAPGKRIIHHYTCPVPGKDCVETVCGNGAVEGTEQCDDKNNKAFDGCSPNCELEPSCPNGKCVAKCGDGLLFDFDGDGDGKPDEECDDGNLKNGDGCSSTCEREAGYTCVAKTEAPPAHLDLPVVLRDFKYWNASDNTSHPDFERYGCSAVTPGLVKTTLTGGVPIYAKGDGCGTQLTSALDFTDWYQDIDVKVGGAMVRRSRRIDDVVLRLTNTAGSYVFDSRYDEPYKTRGGFYPLDGRGWGNQGGNAHNFAFTTELRYWFTYDAATSPKLDFSGDDDVWVFLNGRLALDLGGLHPRQDGSFTLDAAKAASLGPLQDGHLYEVALFHAERHTDASNFWLTLRGFVKKKSECTHVCGDGIKTREEQCDEGDKNANPADGPLPYGSCTTSCTLGPYCGDKTVTNPPEDCDDGVNLTPWTPAAGSSQCAPSCKAPSYCGDQIVQSSFGEQCDNGAANTDAPTAYGECRTNCTLGPRCGDGNVDATFGEQCDNGFNLTPYVLHPGADACAPGCKTPRSCGDGVVDYPFEQCDKGAANTSSGAYGSCTTECKLGPRCGDGVVQPPEQCDDGNRVNGDGCSAACLKENDGPG